MNWSQAATLIARKVAKKYGIEVTDALVEATIEGFKWECSAWINQSR